VMTTTGTAAAKMLTGYFNTIATQWGNPPGDGRTAALRGSIVLAALVLAMLISAAVVVIAAAVRVWGRLNGEAAPVRLEVMAAVTE